MKLELLVVDDEDALREVIKDFFEIEGFRVTEASNGQTAFRLLTDSSFDCVVSDVRMPKGNGIELAKKIHSMAGHKPKIIFLTGYADITEVEAQEMGVLKVITKPFRPQELVSIVSSHLANDLKDAQLKEGE